MTDRQAWLLGLLWGGILAAMPFADFSLRPPRGGLSDYSYEIVRDAPPLLGPLVALLLFASAGPVILAAFRAGLDFRRSGFLPLVALANLAAVTASLIGTSARSGLAYVILVGFVFALGILAVSLRTGAVEMMRGLLCGFSLGVGAVILLVIADANYSYGRLMGRSGPNFWGMTAMAVTFASLAWRPLPVRAGLMAVGLGMIVLVQSRGAMLATAAGLAVVGGLWVRHAGPRQRWLMVFAAVAGVAVIGFAAHEVILEKMLLVGDKGRGLHSGGTGRFAAWVEALRLFAADPWLGVGYRKHEEFITAASSAHNAYLATLADTGLLGFLSYGLLMFGGAALAIRRGWRDGDGAALAVAGLVTGYLVLGLVERMALNTGNALSLLVLQAVAFSFRTPDRGAERVRGGGKVVIEGGV